MCANHDVGGRRERMAIRLSAFIVIVTLIAVFCEARVEADEATPRGKRAKAKPSAPAPAEEVDLLAIPPVPLVPDQSASSQLNAPIPAPQDSVIPPVEIPSPPAPFVEQPAGSSTPVPRVAPRGKSQSGRAADITDQPEMDFSDEALKLVPWEPSKPRTNWYRIGSYAGFGVGALAFGIGVWQGEISRSARIEFATADTQVEIMDAKRRGEVAAERANGWFIGGGAVAGLAAIIFLFDILDAAESPPPKVSTLRFTANGLAWMW